MLTLKEKVELVIDDCLKFANQRENNAGHYKPGRSTDLDKEHAETFRQVAGWLQDIIQEEVK